MGHTLSEDARILSVEEEVDPCELAVLSSLVVPEAGKDVPVSFISGYEDCAPMSASFLVAPKRLAWNRSEATGLGVVAVLYPLFGEAAVVLSVIKRL